MQSRSASICSRFDEFLKQHEEAIMEKYIVPTVNSGVAAWPTCDIYFQNLLYYIGCLVNASAGDGIKHVYHSRLLQAIQKALETLQQLIQHNSEKLQRLSKRSSAVTPWGHCQEDAFTNIRLQRIKEEYERLAMKTPGHVFHTNVLQIAHAAATLDIQELSSLLHTAAADVKSGNYPPYGCLETHAERARARLTAS